VNNEYLSPYLHFQSNEKEVVVFSVFNSAHVLTVVFNNGKVSGVPLNYNGGLINVKQCEKYFILLDIINKLQLQNYITPQQIILQIPVKHSNSMKNKKC
jgi:hypothetical protein